MNDAEIKNKAKTAEWDRFVFTLHGKARRVALVFDRGYEDVEFRTIPDDTSGEEFGRTIAESWQRAKRDEEEDLAFVRCLELGETKGQHVLVRQMTSSDQGEIFRCAKCSKVFPGRFNPYPRLGDMPYSIVSPPLNSTSDKFVRKHYEEHELFWRPCAGKPSTRR